MEAYYNLIYRYNEDRLFEIRHRGYLNLSLRETFGAYTLSWRGRVQGTLRDERVGEYKTNPKYMMKNRLQIEYSIFGSPWQPYLSGELSSELNNPMGNELTRIRFQGGTSWRLNRTDYLDFFLRWDEYLEFKEPRVLSVGIGFKRRF